MTLGPIHIDLRNLSEEHLAQCLPHMGECSYEGPCIIGTLVAPDKRAGLDDYEAMLIDIPDLGGTGIDDLIASGVVTVPEGQKELAQKLQLAFDCSRINEVRSIVAQAQGMAARSDETPQEAQPERQQPGPQDAPEPAQTIPGE